jgi:hypothetical protein
VSASWLGYRMAVHQRDNHDNKGVGHENDPDSRVEFVLTVLLGQRFSSSGWC